VAATPNQPPIPDSRGKRAFGVMNEVRNVLYRRLVEYVLQHQHQLKNEATGEDSYTFTLQQMDEQFLSKLNAAERAVAELSRAESREGQTTTTTYEAIEVLARREELPQKIADTLAAHGRSDLLDMCVLRADDKHAEVLLVMAREETTPPAAAAPAEKKKQDGQGEQGEDRGGKEK
jgi:hypothetical protein